MRQFHGGVHIFSGTQRCEELEDFEEDLDGDFVDGSGILGGSWFVLVNEFRCL
jgi:hypothetical protein